MQNDELACKEEYFWTESLMTEAWLHSFPAVDRLLPSKLENKIVSRGEIYLS